MKFVDINLCENENIKKVRLKSYSWEELMGNKTILYEAICDLLLDNENLFYYATQKESTKTLKDTRLYVKKLIDKKIIDSSIEDIFRFIGWDREELNINNTVFQGDLAEYLMSILIDRVTKIDTLISKISLKTSPKMPAHGNDNIYYDYSNEIFYYGEAKFYDNLSTAINRAKKSLEEHANSLEFSYIKTHDNVVIAKDNTKKINIVETLEEKRMDEVSIKSISFIINDDVYLKKDYESKIIKSFGTIEDVEIKSAEMIMIFLPILSKEEFLKYFRSRL